MQALLTLLEPRADPATTAEPSAPPDWITRAECSHPFVMEDTPLIEAAEHFRVESDLRILPVLDSQRRPVGAIYDSDVRRMLLSPFGHALMRNPAYGSAPGSLVKPCPAAEATLPLSGLIDLYRRARGSDGMILTLNGEFWAVVANRRLLYLTAEQELTRVRARAERGQRVETASCGFERHVEILAEELVRLSAQMHDNASATAQRAGLLGESASSVAAAGAQSRANLAEIEADGQHLARALSDIATNTREAREAAEAATALVARVTERAEDLTRSAQSIDTVIAMIGDIARQVNLLSLNATIEAARAGDAGLGFRVVANEIKQLSNQTSRAASTIVTHVDSIRGSVAAVSSANADVEAAFERISRYSEKIERSVVAEEHVTRRIAQNVGEAVDSADATQNDVEALAAATREASDAAADIQAIAAQLNDGAGRLSRQARDFLQTIRRI
ncbi:methyl-accepting chemotaxis protein [Stakelama pacifica]|uniref:Methyl-accepting chemotaxis protein n=1 Tax=Stakelama pacifica TaxID=517720 RepID=A0A4R6FWH3_9SPHN|nr:methyl-accepting chemotaxis protein [Stakelama pacifica]TDN85660.1 methyl-accepting chemotaxis protein [Stakelama pacifica]GGO92005.1 hypothetical protein GCM10011329_08020 [Stakelama pacifica]